ncbi:MAG: TonB-dependent receptor [Proteobacteria bacterium]|nr:TonB-dependent receptor [Pseudomonadota bacterium]
MSSKLGITITPLAAAVTAALAPVATVQAQDEGAMVIDEIIVTSRKREENMQDIPASIQAIPQILLEKMGAHSIEDYTRFIPAVNAVTYSPGVSTIVFRGINSGSIGTGQSPASMYFDELPLTTTGEQPDVRMIDIARIEALAGPQGSLYGGSAQSGTLRVITNQPDPTQFESIGTLTLKQGSMSAVSHEVSGVLNLPMADGRAALRLVGYTATDGGYIDNVFGHTPDWHYGGWQDTGSGVALPAEFHTEDNSALLEKDWNGTDFIGGRVGFRFDVNDQWSYTLVYNYAKTEGDTGGGNRYDPFAGDKDDLNIISFNKGSRGTEWSAINLTIEVDLGWAQLISATSFLDSETFTHEDATVYIKYYQYWACLIPNYFSRYCFGPTEGVDVLQMQHFFTSKDKFAQEFRLTGGNDENMNWIVGLFYETTNDDWNSPWGDPTNYDYQDSFALAYWEAQTQYGFSPGFAPNAEWGWESISRVEWQNSAVFGEVTWDISDQWTATVGGRYFDRTMESDYIVENPNTIISTPDFIAQGGPSIQKGGSSDFVPKISLAYNADDDKMYYALYSEGFRPGGVNRGRGNPILPKVFDADKLQNFEIGAKTRWAEGRVQLNVTYFNMQWKDYQLRVLDPSYRVTPDPGQPPNPWQQVIFNAGDAESVGFQVELDWVMTDHVSFGMNLVSQESQNLSDISTDGRDASTGFPDDPPEITKGNRLPLAVDFKASAWLDVNWETSFVPGTMFARLQWSHTGDSVNQLAEDSTSANPQITNAAYDIADFRVGLIADTGWKLDFFINNLTDERAEYNAGGGNFEFAFGSVEDGRSNFHRVWTNRPREVGMRFSKRWGE